MLRELQGVLCLMDDVLVYGQDQEEHDKRLEAVLQRIPSAGVTLNSDKCEFSKDQLKFLGHIIDKDGVRADPAKVQAVLDLPTSIQRIADASVCWNDQPACKVCSKLCSCYSSTNIVT